MNVRWMIVLSGLCIGLAACGTNKGDAAIAELESLRAEACACKDRECYDGVRARWRAADRKLKDAYPTRDSAPEALVKAHRDSQRGMRKCRQALRQK